MDPTGTGPTDAALIARVLARDDRHAFEALVRRHQGPVRALLRRMCHGDDALADDLAQETFLLAYRKLDQFRADARFSTWLYRIAYNCFLMQARTRRPELALEDCEHELSDPDAVDDSTPEAGADLQMDLQKAMRVLSPAERAALTQCYYLDRSHEEAAYALNCPVGTVKSHILRARQKLKRVLGAWDERVV